MRTRMVPFQRHVQRLARIVRQAATDTHKRAELAIEGASGELDRQVLERMMPPFEHMLRNAVVHGIEKPEERKKHGKNETGTITIALHREGSEVMVEVSDDGAGMNLKAIRDKGMSLGLVRADQQLSDEDIMQLILEPGFSTAGTISTQAGRGVGMDVVASEIKKLGGALHMETQAGPGHAVHHSPAVHARHQPRAHRARQRRVLRAAAAHGRRRGASVEHRSRGAPRPRGADVRIQRPEISLPASGVLRRPRARPLPDGT